MTTHADESDTPFGNEPPRESLGSAQQLGGLHHREKPLPSLRQAPMNPRQDSWSRVPEGSRSDARSAPLTTILRGFMIGRRRDGYPLQHARQR